MVTITAAMVKELRQKTGVGMMDCKKALKETEGNIDNAVKYLRERGMSKAASKASRETKEGLVFSYIHGNGKIGVLLEMSCETDFVAATDDFKTLCKDIAMQIAATDPIALRPEDIDQKLITEETEIARNKAIKDGKPERIIEKIVEGVVKKFEKTNTLLYQEFIKDSSKDVDTVIKEAIFRLGENIQVARFVRFSMV
ncbi:MAG: translation elongation factor Ts [Candidatus Cloacimonetes bacterium 4572_65]|nr:MAG: translation elongation factor Ts [Candidatus Cloacimonetes bacterium 4572_65]